MWRDFERKSSKITGHCKMTDWKSGYNNTVDMEKRTENGQEKSVKFVQENANDVFVGKADACFFVQMSNVFCNVGGHGVYSCWPFDCMFVWMVDDFAGAMCVCGFISVYLLPWIHPRGLHPLTSQYTAINY